MKLFLLILSVLSELISDIDDLLDKDVYRTSIDKIKVSFSYWIKD
jgi:hypothetical protein